MALSTYKSFLMKKSSSTYSKLVDIKEYPDIEGSPEAIDATTLTDKAKVYVPGLIDQDSLVFPANYDPTDYATLKALEGTEVDLALWFGGTESAGVVTPTGSDGKWEFSGYLSVHIKGSGTNEVRGMEISVLPTTPVTPVLSE